MIKNRNKVLGINARSAVFMRGNKGRAKSLADNKLRTKEILRKQGIKTADLIGVIRERKEALEFDWETLPSSFVVKPNRGFAGEGILIVFNRLKNGNWLTMNKRQLTQYDLEEHVFNILEGQYSLLETPDVALFESRLSIDPVFKRFSSQGIPDIRVVVYNTVPVMAMLRVPTKKSGGRANLAQGGLGIGIDVTTGLTTYVVQKSWLYEKEIERHPDTKLKLRGVKVPYWDEVLKTAVLAARVVGLKYVGVDISVDKKRGPVVLELNARPGLGIQVANMTPLRERLERLTGLKVTSPERGISIAKELFAGQFEEEVASITGREIIGLIETVSLYGKDKINKKVKAKIDTGADNSSIGVELARELGFGDALDLFETTGIPSELSQEEAKELAPDLEKRLLKENTDIKGLSIVSSSHGVSIRIRVAITAWLSGYKMDIQPTVVDRSHLKYPILIGRRNLSHFLIDTTKVPLRRRVIKRTPTMTGSETNNRLPAAHLSATHLSAHLPPTHSTAAPVEPTKNEEKPFVFKDKEQK